MAVRRPLLPLALLAGTVAILSCGEPSSPLPAGQASLDASPSPDASDQARKAVHDARLARCRPMPEARGTGTIGKEGGVIQVGPHTLTIPPGALRRTVTITGTAPSDTVGRIQFQPEGLRFKKTVALAMSYENCEVYEHKQLQMVYTDDSLVILEHVQSKVRGSSVVGEIEHFSNYALSW
jgi:hypothetical protein